MTPSTLCTGRAPLFEALPPAYDVATETIRAGGRSFSMLVVRDTNRLLDAIDPAAFARDERLPYWAEVWTSAVALAEWCLGRHWPPGTQVLELGCGLGLAGLAAAAAGADVTMTDYEEDALRFARSNAERNLPGSVLRSRLRFQVMDWRAPSLDRHYNVILGADIVYERRIFSPLLGLMELALAPGGSAVLTDPDRSAGKAFLLQAERVGFLAIATPCTVQRDGRSARVVRMELRKET